MNILKRILTKNKFIKNSVKNMYQIFGTIFSDKKSNPQFINDITLSDEESMFGYYDKSPWSKDMTKFIYLETKDLNKKSVINSATKIVLLDLTNNTKRYISKTNICNSQQGAMLQWVGPSFNEKILYNDKENGNYVTKIFEVNTGKISIIDFPVYSVSKCGTKALTLDFERLHLLRPGYGYSLTNKTKKKTMKEDYSYCIGEVDLINNKMKEIVSYEDFYFFNEKSKSKRKSFHKVNHIMYNPTGEGFIFTYRIVEKNSKIDKLYYYSLKKCKLKLILDTGMVSHCNWINDHEIVAYANHPSKGPNLLRVSINGEVSILSSFFKDKDGHPSISPDMRYIVMDSYPNFSRKQMIYLFDIETPETVIEIASIYSNFKYRNINRCDLHPRWSPDSSMICFDAAIKNKRKVYTIKVPQWKK